MPLIDYKSPIINALKNIKILKKSTILREIYNTPSFAGFHGKKYVERKKIKVENTRLSKQLNFSKQESKEVQQMLQSSTASKHYKKAEPLVDIPRSELLALMKTTFQQQIR